jgi:hypothetical protein
MGRRVQGSGFRVRERGGRGQRAEVRREVRGQRAEVRGGGRREVRGQRAEVRGGGGEFFHGMEKFFGDFPRYGKIFSTVWKS